eukprot:5519832-Alexandrium_andersonii.AAC.1
MPRAESAPRSGRQGAAPAAAKQQDCASPRQLQAARRTCPGRAARCRGGPSTRRQAVDPQARPRARPGA